MDGLVAIIVMYNFFTAATAWGIDLTPIAREVFRVPTPALPAAGRRSRQTGPRYRRKSRTSTGSTV